MCLKGDEKAEKTEHKRQGTKGVAPWDQRGALRKAFSLEPDLCCLFGIRLLTKFDTVTECLATMMFMFHILMGPLFVHIVSTVRLKWLSGISAF